MRAKGRKQPAPSGSVRIIAGQWRGRRLPVPDVEGLRPSGDRSRETLFNWLQPYLAAARCVDLFAGTGVLGLEAVSRGAAEAVLVDKSRTAVVAMRRAVELLDATHVSVVEADALAWLPLQAIHSADIVLLDPPFGLDLAQLALTALDAADVVAPGGVVYVESPRHVSPPHAGPRCSCIKEKILGEVRMQLLRKD